MKKVFKGISCYFLLSLLWTSAYANSNFFSPQENQYLKNVIEENNKSMLIGEEIELLMNNSANSYLTENIILSQLSWIKHIVKVNDLEKTLLSSSYSIFNHLKEQHLLSFAIEHLKKGDLSLATHELDSLLNMKKATDNYSDFGELSEQLSILSYLQNNYSQAEKYNQQALDNYLILSENKKVFKSLIWKSQLLTQQKKYKICENLLLKQLIMMSVRLKNKTYEMQCYYQLGKNYFEQQKMTEAKWFFVQSLNLSQKTGNKKAIAKNLLLLAKVKFYEADYALALKDMTAAQKYIDTYSYYNLDVSQQFSDLYKKIGNSSKYKFYNNQFKEIKERFI